MKQNSFCVEMRILKVLKFSNKIIRKEKKGVKMGWQTLKRFI